MAWLDGPCPRLQAAVLDVAAGAGHGGRWLSKSISFWISALQQARSGIVWFSPPLLLALPHDPFFRSSGDAGCSLSHLEKCHKKLQIKADP